MEIPARVRFPVLGVTATLFAVPAAETQPALEPGLWRITVSSTTNGKPDPEQDTRQCLDAELKDIANYFAPQLEGVEAQCSRTRQPSDDPRVLAYRMQCSGPGFTTSAVTSVNIEDSRRFHLTMRIDSRSDQESAIVEVKGDGTWVGNCPG